MSSSNVFTRSIKPKQLTQLLAPCKLEALTNDRPLRSARSEWRRVEPRKMLARLDSATNDPLNENLQNRKLPRCEKRYHFILDKLCSRSAPSFDPLKRLPSELIHEAHNLSTSHNPHHPHPRGPYPTAFICNEHHSPTRLPRNLLPTNVANPELHQAPMNNHSLEEELNAKFRTGTKPRYRVRPATGSNNMLSNPKPPNKQAIFTEAERALIKSVTQLDDRSSWKKQTNNSYHRNESSFQPLLLQPRTASHALFHPSQEQRRQSINASGMGSVKRIGSLSSQADLRAKKRGATGSKQRNDTSRHDGTEKFMFHAKAVSNKKLLRNFLD